MLNILKNGIGYVTFTYKDGSVRVFRSTLNTALLVEHNIPITSEGLYDLDRKEVVNLSDKVKVNITEDKPELEDINEFANRFI